MNEKHTIKQTANQIAKHLGLSKESKEYIEIIMKRNNELTKMGEK